MCLFDRNIWFYTTLILAAVLVFQLGAWYGSSEDQTGAATDCPVEVEANNSGAVKDLSAIDRSGDGLLGDPEAGVTIVEYSDFRCGFCQRFTQETFGKLVKNYVETGKVNFKFNHFPINPQSVSMDIAIASECASRQNKFWEFKTTAMREEISGDEQSLLETASQAGVQDMEQFESCVKNREFAGKVKKQRAEAASRGVSSTPTFFINSTKITGAKPFEEFAKVIEEKLKK